MLDFDGLLEKIGPFGRYQTFFHVIFGLASIPSGFQTLLSVYVFATPDHWCHVTELANLSIEEQRRLTVPPSGLSDYPSDDSCYVMDLNYTEVYLLYTSNRSDLLPNTTRIKTCTDWGYDMDLYGPTATTEWDLVCSKATLTTVASSTFMLGFLIGVTLFGYISDRIGRRPSWMIGLTSGVFLTTLSAFMPEYWSFIIIRMFGGIALSGQYTTSFVLVMEMIGKEKRVVPGILFQVWFTLGYVSLAGFAYFIKNYKWLNFTVSIIAVICIPLFWVIPESARWLLTTGRVEYAKLEIKRMGRMNKVPVTDTLTAFDAFLVGETKKDVDPERRYSMIDLVRTPRLRARSLNTMFNWFVCSLVFYGISLGVTDLAGDPYINMVISGASELVGMGAAVIMLNKLGRRWPLCAMFLFGGLCCLAINFIPTSLSILGTILAMLGKFGVAGAFAIMYVYTAELFPTVVRTIAVGSGSMGARIGGLIAPFVPVLGVHLWGPLPMMIFGGLSVLAGGLALLLPETLHQKLPESLEEGESFGKNNRVKLFSLPKKNSPALV